MANKKRLIDANDAVKMLRGKCVAKYPSTFFMGLLASATEIEQMPTVDAVEVVRCKDCKHYEDHKRKIYENCTRKDRFIPMKPDDFCSYGERREGE